jgi:HEAT repeat protein
MLRDVMLDRSVDAKLRGYAALAIGMIEPKGDAIRADLRSVLMTEDRREIRVQAAIAAGLLADRATVTALVEILNDRTQSQYVLGSVALALGQSGAEEAVPHLIRIATDGAKYPDLTRALATVALGQIGDRSDVPVLSRISTDVNYRDQPSYEVELLSIL